MSGSASSRGASAESSENPSTKRLKATKPPLVFVTGNAKKLEVGPDRGACSVGVLLPGVSDALPQEVKRMLGPDLQFEVVNQKIDLPELQVRREGIGMGGSLLLRQ